MDMVAGFETDAGLSFDVDAGVAAVGSTEDLRLSSVAPFSHTFSVTEIHIFKLQVSL